MSFTLKMSRNLFYSAIIFITIFKYSVTDTGLFRKKIARIDLFKGSCRGHENVAILFKNLRVIRQNGLFIIFGKIVVTEDNFKEFKVVIKSKRCKSKETPDTCEEMPPFVFNKFCENFRRKNQAWTPFLDSITPYINCPAKKGVYVISNGTFDVGPLLDLPLADLWYWKSQTEVYEQNTNVLVMCSNIDGQIIPA